MIQSAPSFCKQISFPESFVIYGTGTTNHGLAAEDYLGVLSAELGSINTWEWIFKNSNIALYENASPSNVIGFPSLLTTTRAGNFLTLYFFAKASSVSLIKPNYRVF